MKTTLKFVSVSLALLLVGACQSIGEPRSAMTYEECRAAKYCRITGTLSIREVDHVKMGRLDVGEAQCVNVSLPENKVKNIEAKGVQTQIIAGKVFPGIMDADIASLKINGRRIGLSQCGDFYVFVK